MASLTVTASGEEALERLNSAEPSLYLSPSPELSQLARAAASHLFSSLASVCPKPPFGALLAGEEFDAEQIWGQVDSLSAPLVSMLRREVKRLEQEPPVLVPVVPPSGGVADVDAEEDADREEVEDDDEEDAEEDEKEANDDDDDDDDDDDEEEEEEEEEEMVGDGEGNGVEDRFLKIKELQDYLEKAEAEEYGFPEPKKRRKKDEDDEEESEEEENDDEEEEDGEDLEDEDLDDDEDKEVEFGESARYEDFYGGKKKTGGGKNNDSKKEKGSSKKVKFADELEGSDMDDEQNDNVDNDAQGGVLSTHEKELQKLHSKIEQMEKANLEPKSWIMQGEVTAIGRPKNSALEVDLDFQHNIRPAPVITEEVTASLEDLIRKRIIEEDFDDVQKTPALPSKAPKELKEMDENKSKKGLAEIYEEEYAQKAGLVSAPLSSSDEQKKEATILFKKLCLKLDALSHFHFAPKPIIEDLSIQANVPALAMEEIAPLAVSDAAMLAPEEVYKGKGDIKEEAELTQAERKRRRANKKRRYKAGEAKRGLKERRNSVASGLPDANEDKRVAKKARFNGASGNPNGKENPSHNNLPGWKKV